MPSKLSFEELVSRANQIHDNKYTYWQDHRDPANKFRGYCEEHKVEFLTDRVQHIKTKAPVCKHCSDRKRVKGQLTLTNEEFKNRSSLVYNDFYHYDKTRYVNQNTKVLITCPLHGDFWVYPQHHYRGTSGCEQCSDRVRTTDFFIKKSKEIHGDRYNYDLVDYHKSDKKIIIICSIHGEFNQRPDSHLQGKGCQRCKADEFGKRTRSTNSEFIEKSKLIYGDHYNYDQVVYRGCDIPVNIHCSIHGYFQQTPSNHLTRGCIKCGKAKSNKKILADNGVAFLEKAIGVHGHKYNYSETVYAGTDKKVIINCLDHGKFHMFPLRHLKGSGCPSCSRQQRIKEEKPKSVCMIKTTKFVEKAKLIHDSKYTYDNTRYISSNLKVQITCPEHGEFSQTPRHHLGRKGCRKCYGVTVATRQTLSNEKCIEKFISVHGDRYDYSQTHYVRSDQPVKIICREHGEFMQLYSVHYSGGNCPQCARINSGKKRSETISMSHEDFIKACMAKHGNTFDYSKTAYSRGSEKITIICHKHGEFIQRASSHLYEGRGCASCIKYSSAPEKEWLSYLGIEEKYHQKWVLGSRFRLCDAYVPETNTIYEFNGDYWHGNPIIFDPDSYNNKTKCTFGQLYQKTLTKEDEYRSAGYNVVSIWENEWKILKSTLGDDNN